MDKMLYLAILLVLGVFFMKKMVKPPVGPSYRLKSIFFTKTKEEVSEADFHIQRQEKDTFADGERSVDRDQSV